MLSRSFGVLLVSANDILQSVLPTLLSRQDGLVFRGLVSSPEEALTLPWLDALDIVISDLAPASLESVLAWRAIRELGPHLVMLTRYAEQSIDMPAVLAGASGLLLVPEQPVIEAVQRVATGELVRSPELTGRLRAIASGETPSPLDSQERSLFGLIAGGNRDSDVAAYLGTSLEDVREQVALLVEKLI